MRPDLKAPPRPDLDELPQEESTSIFELPLGERLLVACLIGPAAICMQWATVWMIIESPNWKLDAVLMLLEPLPASLMLATGALIAPRSWCGTLLRQRRKRIFVLIGLWTIVPIVGVFAGIGWLCLQLFLQSH